MRARRTSLPHCPSISIRAGLFLIVAGTLLTAVGTSTRAKAAIRFDAPLLTQFGGTTSQQHPDRPTVADLDGDGNLDVIVHDPNSFTDSLVVLFGRGDGTFAPPLAVSTPGASTHTVIADIDGDGALDIAYATSSDGVHGGILFGDGTGKNWAYSSISSLKGIDLCVGDFDGDRKPDLALASSSDHQIRVLLSRPGRTFQPVTSSFDSLGGSVSFGMQVADLNRDGKADLVISAPGGSPDLFVLLGHGDGTFAAHSIYDLSLSDASRGFDVADVNGDGILDIVAAYRSKIAVFPGVGDGTFSAPETLTPQPSLALAVAVADVNGDGVPDIVAADAVARSLIAWRGLGGGTFAPPRASAMGHGLFPVILADVDGDERLDVVSMEPSDFNAVDAEGIVVALGDGQGGFGKLLGRALVPLEIMSLAVGDLDGDGLPDLLAISSNGGSWDLQSVLSRSGHSFATTAAIPLDGRAYGIKLADLDEDGHLDATVLLGLSRIAVLRGIGDGSFSPPYYVSTDTLTTHGYSFRDVTADGHLDLVTVSGTHIKVYPGHGDGTFGAPVDSPMGTQGGGGVTAMGDLNGDGVLDFAWNVSSTGWTLAIGAADFTFHPVSIPGAPVYNPTSTTADLDGDGRQDILATDVKYMGLLGGVLIARLQLANGTFTPFITSQAPQSSVEPGSIADVDGDGIPEVVCVRHGDIVVNRGLGGGRYAVENGYGGLGAIVSNVAADFDGDGHMDVAVGYRDSVCYFFGRDAIPPSAALLAPSQGDWLAVGASVPIRWSAADAQGVASVDLFASRHGPRGPFERIALGLANSGEFDWAVTTPFSDSVVFKVVARDPDGNVGRAVSSGPIRIVDPAAVNNSRVPRQLAIESISPNPGHERLTIRFSVPRAGRAKLALYDLQGRRVALLFDVACQAGEATADWKASGAARSLHAGLYFARLNFDGQVVSARVAMIP